MTSVVSDHSPHSNIELTVTGASVRNVLELFSSNVEAGGGDTGEHNVAAPVIEGVVRTQHHFIVTRVSGW